jgi:hypothetical protein
VVRASNKSRSKLQLATSTPTRVDDAAFAETSTLIAKSRLRAFLSVDTILIDLYSKVGEIISNKIEAAEWGDGTVDELAQYVARDQPNVLCFA